MDEEHVLHVDYLAYNKTHSTPWGTVNDVKSKHILWKTTFKKKKKNI